MRSDHTPNRRPDPRVAPARRRRWPPVDPKTALGSEQVDLIQFDWRTTAGLQPVILVTRRRLD